ncbi:hypothetical protein TeGR_g10757 [Tetraparma gracilis]|uniref:Uncharacterized protein n=1 Tax=Tetraparma gracilis TaxID=2962635 RepID=A0ABQ6MVZ4_9STRA|nr:hypothetical protein TeGR_g10757 [Tetraparma gracilis]
MPPSPPPSPLRPSSPFSAYSPSSFLARSPPPRTRVLDAYIDRDEQRRASPKLPPLLPSPAASLLLSPPPSSRLSPSSVPRTPTPPRSRRSSIVPETPAPSRSRPAHRVVPQTPLPAQDPPASPALLAGDLARLLRHVDLREADEVQRGVGALRDAQLRAEAVPAAGAAPGPGGSAVVSPFPAAAAKREIDDLFSSVSLSSSQLLAENEALKRDIEVLASLHGARVKEEAGARRAAEARAAFLQAENDALRERGEELRDKYKGAKRRYKKEVQHVKDHVVTSCLDRFKLLYTAGGGRRWEARLEGDAGGEEVMEILEDLLRGLDILQYTVQAL